MGRKQVFSKEQVLRAIRNWIVHRAVAPTIEELHQTLGVGSIQVSAEKEDVDIRLTRM